MNLKNVTFLLFVLMLSCGSLGTRRVLRAGGSPNSTKVESKDEVSVDPAEAEFVLKSIHSETLGGTVSDTRRQEALTLIDNMPRRELEKSKDEFQGGEVGKAISYKLAKMAYHVGDRENLDALIEEAGESDWLGEEVKAFRNQLVHQIQKNRVAVLLPLSGPYGRIGKTIKQAIVLAADGDAELSFLDTKGTHEGAVDAVRRAAEIGASFILGPVGQGESYAAASEAVRRRLPIVLLSSGEGAPSEGVFRLWSSENSEAEQAAIAAVDIGMSRFAVFGPRDEHGEAQARAFAREARRRGAEVVVEQFYDPTGTELQPDLKKLFALDPEKNERYRKHLRDFGVKDGWKTFSPDVNFDAIFIPDVYDKAALVASYLPFFNVEVRSRDVMNTMALKRKHGGRIPSVVQLIGTSGWHHPGLIPRGGKAVEGAIVIDLFSGGRNVDASSEPAARFHEAFIKRYNRAPGRTAAQAFDAATMALRVHEVSKGQSREFRQAFIEGLQRLKLEDGACGPARVLPTGGLQRAGVVLRVEHGSFKMLGF